MSSFHDFGPAGVKALGIWNARGTGGMGAFGAFGAGIGVTLFVTFAEGLAFVVLRGVCVLRIFVLA